jgi:hypothetical protein
MKVEGSLVICAILDELALLVGVAKQTGNQ